MIKSVFCVFWMRRTFRK